MVQNKARIKVYNKIIKIIIIIIIIIIIKIKIIIIIIIIYTKSNLARIVRWVNRRRITKEREWTL